MKPIHRIAKQIIDSIFQKRLAADESLVVKHAITIALDGKHHK